MGGALTVLSMVHVPEADAGVAWYGFPPLEYVVDASAIKAPLMGHFATRDGFFAIAGVDALEDKLRSAWRGLRVPPLRRDARVRQRDPGRPEPAAGLRYQPDAAALAWTRTLRFSTGTCAEGTAGL